MDEAKESHSREVYNILALLGDLGGIFEIVMIIFGVFIFPISEHSFNLRASRMMFFARTKLKNLFEKPKDGDDIDKL